MDYTICISPTCPSCASTLKSLEKMKIDFTIQNIDQFEQSLCPSPIIPALYQGDDLIAYGSDIIKYFSA